MGYQVFERECMGTKFILLIDEDEGRKCKQGANLAFREAERLNLVLSDYEDSSELSRFSASSLAGKKFKLSNDLLNVLSHGQSLARETEGAFDVSIGPLSRLWRIARFQRKMPAKEKLLQARSLVGYQKLLLYPAEQTGSLQAPGMVLDLGGIAKGYAADQMLLALRKNGLGRCLIDAGGDLVIGDAPRNSRGWRVEIGGRKHPQLPILHLSNQAVATSGDLEQFVLLEGRRFSHLIDPHSGQGLTNRSQVTVIAPSGMEADSLASAFLVMGLRKSKEYVDKKKVITAYYLQKNDFKATLSILGQKERK